MCGCTDARAGCPFGNWHKRASSGVVRSQLGLLDESFFNHRIDIVEGVMREECSELLKRFLRNVGRSKLVRARRKLRLSEAECSLPNEPAD